MANLVIVESPAKAKTIEKYLGKKYRVVASVGHVRDLPKSEFGVDVDHDFAPKYISIRGKSQVINTLKKEVKNADKVFLATATGYGLVSCSKGSVQLDIVSGIIEVENIEII